MPYSPISFISDFGHSDEFVGVVHGVIAKIAPDVKVIDVTHGIQAGDVRGGALALLRAIQYLPEGVVLAVVDPGVGTARRPIAVQTDWGVFIGPDNGLLSPAVAMVGGASAAHALDNPEFVIPAAGSTFDGRDRFGPAAAVIAGGSASISELGSPIDPQNLTPMLLPLPEHDTGRVTGATWWVDHFGNVQTNLSPDDLDAIGIVRGGDVALTIGPADYALPFVEAYGDVASGSPMLIIDSQGLVALSVRDGRADEFFEIGVDRPVTLRRQADVS